MDLICAILFDLRPSPYITRYVSPNLCIQQVSNAGAWPIDEYIPQTVEIIFKSTIICCPLRGILWPVEETTTNLAMATAVAMSPSQVITQNGSTQRADKSSI